MGRRPQIPSSISSTYLANTYGAGLLLFASQNLRRFACKHLFALCRLEQNAFITSIHLVLLDVYFVQLPTRSRGRGHPAFFSYGRSYEPRCRTLVPHQTLF